MRKSYWLGIILCYFMSCGKFPFETVSLDSLPTLRVERMDKAVIRQNFAANKQQYGKPFEWYALQITPIDEVAALEKEWHYLLEDSLFNFIQKEIEIVFGDVKKEEEDFAKAFGYLQHYFSDLPIPQIFSVNSGLNYGNQWADSVLFVGLDLYLGAENPVTVHSAFPLYLRNLMTREN